MPVLLLLRLQTGYRDNLIIARVTVKQELETAITPLLFWLGAKPTLRPRSRHFPLLLRAAGEPPQLPLLLWDARELPSPCPGFRC